VVTRLGRHQGSRFINGPNATARCGELEITAGNGKKSIDTVMVTVGGKSADLHQRGKCREQRHSDGRLDTPLRATSSSSDPARIRKSC